MANPLKILTQLSASKEAEFEKAVTFREDVAMSGKKITGLAAGTLAGEAVRYEQLSTETSRAGSVEASLSTGLSAEASRASSIEISLAGSLSGLVSAEASRATSYETWLSTQLSTEGSNRIAGDSTEVSRAQSAEAVLSTAISSEASRAFSIEQSVIASLSSEVSRAQSVEGSLSTLNANEASRAQSTENSLASQISTETSRASSAETSLSGAISAEGSARAQGVTSLMGLISTETSRANSVEGSLATVDSSLSTSLSTETSRAGSVEVSLSTKISTETSRAGSVEGSLSNALSTEFSRAFEVENSIATALYAETSRAVSVESSIATNYLRIDGSSFMSGTLQMNQNDINNARTGSFSDLIAANATINGNLTVNGGVTYVDAVNLQVTDKKVTIGAVTGNVGTGALSFLYDAGIYLGSDTDPAAKIINDYGAAGGEWLLSNSAGVAIAATGSDTMVGLGLGPGYDLYVNNGKYNVETALRSIYKSINTLNSNATSTNTDMATNYAKLRYVEEATLDAQGHKEFNLSGSEFVGFKLGSAGGLLGSLSAVTADVMIKDGASWTNDLVSLRIDALNTNWVKITVDAPASPNAQVRLVAVNETKNNNILLGSLTP